MAGIARGLIKETVLKLDLSPEQAPGEPRLPLSLFPPGCAGPQLRVVLRWGQALPATWQSSSDGSGEGGKREITVPAYLLSTLRVYTGLQAVYSWPKYSENESSRQLDKAVVFLTDASMGASKLASKRALGSSKAFRKDFTLSFSCLHGTSSSNPGYWFVSRLHYWKAMFWLCYIAVGLRSCSAIWTVDLLHGFFSERKYFTNTHH